MRHRVASGFVLALMAVGCLVLWIGVPLGALYVGSKLTSSFGPHLVIALSLSVAGMLVVAMGLLWINDLYMRITGVSGSVGGASGVRRGGPLEPMLFACLVAAVVALVLWFFLLAENPTVNVY